MTFLSYLRGPLYIFLSFAIPASICFVVYELYGVTSLLIWCFVMFVGVHMLYGEGARRHNSMHNMRAGTASKQVHFWFFMMIGANLAHYGIIAVVWATSNQWHTPLDSNESVWFNVHSLLTLAVLFSLVFFTLKPSVIKEQGPSVEYGGHGYWKMTRHPLMMHLFVVFFLFFLERVELTNISLWFMLYLVIGVSHQNNRNKEAVAGKPNFDLRQAPRAFFEEFCEKPKANCFLSPKTDLVIVTVLSLMIWIGGDQLFFVAILGIVSVMSAMGCWYAFGLKVTNENYLEYRANPKAID